ncbi:hypothetical protein FKW77_004886 [Venturia effusa]|uniref:Uncharacterized protein n=1 Tax=Venturia effusa TaxID=50376 RepID=A0A517LIP4_9PEZI|nr:hypothetical protein FKW77_004886 [Venturia effusa]
METLANSNADSNRVKSFSHVGGLLVHDQPRPSSWPQSLTTLTLRANLGDDADDAGLFDVPEKCEVDESSNYDFKLEHCANCRRRADLFCSRCCDAPSSAKLSSTRTSYCSTSCQTLHFDRHRPACDILAKRKALMKAAKLLNSIWQRIRARAYPFNITQISKQDGLLAIHHGDEDRNINGRIFFDAPPLTTLKSPELRDQILLMGSSRTSIALLHTVAKELFLEVGCDYIREITIPVEDPIVHYDCEGVERDWTESIAHVVFEIGLQNAEPWILDLTAAAIGHDYLICPWRDWLGMTEHGYDEHPLGHQAAQLKHVRGDMNLAFIYTQIHYLSLKMIPERFKTKLEHAGVILKDCHKAPDSRFPQVHAAVLRHLDLAIEEWAEFMTLPQTMDDIGSIFKELAISTMGEQAVRDDLRKIKDRGKGNRVGVEHEILRVFRDKKVLSEEDKMIHDVMRDMFFA